MYDARTYPAVFFPAPGSMSRYPKAYMNDFLCSHRHKLPPLALKDPQYCSASGANFRQMTDAFAAIVDKDGVKVRGLPHPGGGGGETYPHPGGEDDVDGAAAAEEEVLDDGGPGPSTGGDAGEVFARHREIRSDAMHREPVRGSAPPPHAAHREREGHRGGHAPLDHLWVRSHQPRGTRYDADEDDQGMGAGMGTGGGVVAPRRLPRRRPGRGRRRLGHDRGRERAGGGADE